MNTARIKHIKIQLHSIFICYQLSSVHLTSEWDYLNAKLAIQNLISNTCKQLRSAAQSQAPNSDSLHYLHPIIISSHKTRQR